MLTADMVRARRRGDTLTLAPLVPAGPKAALARAELRQLAERTIEALTQRVGHTREDVDAALSGLVVRAALKKVAVGLGKLALDACEFSADAGDDARALRAQLFADAAAARMAASSQQEFSVTEAMRAAAERAGCSVEELRVRLYADLRGQHVLLKGPALSAERLLDGYELGQAQAVLLRATEVRVVVSDPHAPTLRYLFHKLKFHGLLHEIHVASASPAGAVAVAGAAGPAATRYAITLSGPLSLFQASTKYGLALALTLPALRACASFELEADVLWGPSRDRLRFELSGGRDALRAAGAAGSDGDGDGDGDVDANAHPTTTAPSRAPATRPEVDALLASFEKLDGPWQAAHSGEILNVPGLGVCVPDLTFTHRGTGRAVHLEVLGFWSRDAVFRRVELIEAGLDAPMIVAVPARLRVSEAVLDRELPGSLYVYKSVLSRKAVLERLDALHAAAER